MRQLIATLVLVNLLFLIWNYSFPYSDPLVENYRPPASLTELRLQGVPASQTIESGADEAAPSPESSPQPVQVDEGTDTDNDKDSGADIKVPNLASSVFVCGSIGPMFSAEEQTSVMALLSLETRAELSVRVDKNKRDISYWVMIPPLATLAEARSYMRILAENSMNEGFIVTDESNRNAISLGVFRSKEKAQRLLSRVREVPLETEAKMVVRGSHNYWVDFRSEVNGDYYKAIGDLLKQRKHLQHTEANCP